MATKPPTSIDSPDGGFQILGKSDQPAKPQSRNVYNKHMTRSRSDPLAADVAAISDHDSGNSCIETMKQSMVILVSPSPDMTPAGPKDVRTSPSQPWSKLRVLKQIGGRGLFINGNTPEIDVFLWTILFCGWFGGTPIDLKISMWIFTCSCWSTNVGTTQGLQ